MVWGPIGVTAFEADELPLVPPVLVAVALKVYVVPFVSPETVQDPVSGFPEGLLMVQVRPPGDDVTRNDAGVVPPPSVTVIVA